MELDVDMDGARRLLAASNLLLHRTGFDEPRLAPLLELHEAMARHCAELAFGSLVRDSHPRVRAAALLACVQATGNRTPEVVAQGLRDPASEVRTAAANALLLYGIPHAPPEATPALRGAARRDRLSDHTAARVPTVVDSQPLSGARRSTARDDERPDGCR